MPFRFPVLLILFFLIFTGGKVIPFLLIGFGLWFALAVVRQGYRFEPTPTIGSDELANLRTDVAASLLQVDDDVRMRGNREAKARYEAAGAYYTEASKVLDRGVRRRERDAVARTLYRARYELEATAAALDGRTLPAEPEPPARQRTQPRRAHHRRRHNYCGW